MITGPKIISWDLLIKHVVIFCLTSELQLVSIQTAQLCNAQSMHVWYIKDNNLPSIVLKQTYYYNLGHIDIVMMIQKAALQNI